LWPWPAHAQEPRDHEQDRVVMTQTTEDSWVAYNRAFADGCWEDFITTKRRLVPREEVEVYLPLEQSTLYKGRYWTFGHVVNGCP
jgi:hypothetical protein